MIIHDCTRRTQLEAGMMKILAHDSYSVTVNVIGLDRNNGNQTDYDLVMSWNEVAALAAALRKHNKQGA